MTIPLSCVHCAVNLYQFQKSVRRIFAHPYIFHCKQPDLSSHSEAPSYLFNFSQKCFNLIFSLFYLSLGLQLQNITYFIFIHVVSVNIWTRAFISFLQMLRFLRQQISAGVYSAARSSDPYHPQILQFHCNLGTTAVIYKGGSWRWNLELNTDKCFYLKFGYVYYRITCQFPIVK